MAYTLSWETKNPGLMVFLVDQSSSMDEKLGNKKKSEVVVDCTKSILDNLVGECQKKMAIRNKFTCIIIGYHTDAEVIFKGNAPTVSDYLDKGKPILEAKAKGLTNMEEAFLKAADEIINWVNIQQQAGKPTPAPHVVNITDGHPEMRGVSDDEAMKRAENAAKKLMSIQTVDGNVLLSNVFIHDSDIKFPNRIEEIREKIHNEFDRKRAEFLFRISSSLTETLVVNAFSYGMATTIGSSMLLCSNNPKDILNFMDFASHHQNSVEDDPYPIG